MISRRAFLGGLAVAAAPIALGCSRPGGEPGVLRLGVMANLTHGPMLTAIGSGRLARALGSTKLEVRTFRAGPRVTEALQGNAIDMGTAGPGPIVSMHTRHGDRPLVLLVGCASGGASLVGLPSVKSAADLAHRQVATAQLGSTQDISLRKYLSQHGLVSEDKGGTVKIHALAAANILEQMRRGSLAAAWMAEPWATRVIKEIGARRMLDERELWPDRRFPTALLTARRAFRDVRRAEVDTVVSVLTDEVARFGREPAAMKDLVNAELKRITIKSLSRPVLDEAWTRVDFTTDTLPSQLAQMAKDACALGYVPHADCAGLLA